MNRSQRVSTLLLSLTLSAACVPDDGTGGSTLATNRSLTTLTQGATFDLLVDARDRDYQALSFTVTTESDCFTLSEEGGAFSIEAGDTQCEGDVLVTASNGLTQEVHVAVVDPLAMDLGAGLMFRYTNAYQWRWNDSGSGGSHDFSFWHPVAPEGYYPLGSVIRNDHTDITITRDVPVIVVRDSLGAGVLAAPTSYELIWGDWGSGADNDGSVWLPVCPEGYAALGVVVQTGYDAPSTEDVRCVQDDYVTSGSVGDFITNDSGTGSDMDLGVWRVAPPSVLASTDGRLPLATGTSIACGGHDPQVGCAAQMGAVNVLMLSLPITDLADTADVDVRLTGHQPLDVSIPRYFSSVKMPFTLVPAAANSRIDFHVNESPFYTVYRTESYATLADGVVDNRQGSNPVRKLYQFQTGLSETETDVFSLEIGVKVTAGGEASFLGTGGSWEVEMSTQFGWEESRSSTYSTVATNETEFTIPAGAYAQIVQVRTKFIAVDAFGTALDAQIIGDSSIVKYLEYRGE